jgi:hypothetical protein
MMRTSQVVFMWTRSCKHLDWDIVPLKCVGGDFSFAVFSPYKKEHFEDQSSYRSIDAAIAEGRQFVESRDALYRSHA